MQTCLFRGEITTFCCVMRLKSRDFSLIWALLHDFPPFSLQICAFVREKSCSPINFSRFARLLPLKVVISSSFWPAITTPRLCLHYLTIGMKKGKNVSTFFPFFSVYFRATAACGMRAVAAVRGMRAVELCTAIALVRVAAVECGWPPDAGEQLRMWHYLSS